MPKVIAMTHKGILWLIILLILLSVGCSSGNPVGTEIKVVPDKTDEFFPYFIPDNSNSGMMTGQGLLGVFDLHVDSAKLSAEITPSRNVSSEGDSFITNLMPYFTSVPCTTCLRVIDVSIDSENHVAIKFETTHPFGPADPAQPPTGKNRDDLRLFDVKLVVIAQGEAEFPSSGMVLKSGYVANADGYAHIEDMIIDKGDDIPTNAYPYIILAEDPTEGNVDPSSQTGFTDLMNATGHNVLNQGKSYQDTLELNLPYGDIIDAKLALFGQYGQSAQNFLDRLTPQYWLPEFNMKEPWKIEVEITDNNLDDSSAYTTASLRIKVWDWQHSNTKIDQMLSTLDSIKAESKIESVTVEIPGVNQPVDVATTPVSGNGLNTTPLVYDIEVTNDNLASPGIYPGLVKVVDNRQQGLNWGGLGELVDYIPGTGLQFYKVYEFATYQSFKILVADAGGPPCGPITSRIQYGQSGGFLANLTGNEINVLDGQEWIIKVQPQSPNAEITNISFDFDDPNFEDQSGGDTSLRRTYDNPDCQQNDPYELHLTITITDDCPASADWVFEITIYIHCREECGPLVAGNISYSVNGGDFFPFPVAGITIQHNDELTLKTSDFNSGNASIESYTWDFHDTWIADQTKTTSTITRVIPHPDCTLAGNDPYIVLVDLIVKDDCPTTPDYKKTNKINVECTAPCGPIGGGFFRYSFNGSPLVLVPDNRLTISNGSEIEFKLEEFDSPNANIINYTFDFDDPAYPDQSGSENSITRTFSNDNCIGGIGAPQYVTMSYRIIDDCLTSVDYTGELEIQIICSSCYGTGISFAGPHTVLASQTNFNSLDITKSDGGGTKITEASGNTIFAGFTGRRLVDSKTGIGFRVSLDNGLTWPEVLQQFLVSDNMPGGFSILAASGGQIVVAPWYDSVTNKVYLERSINSGINFNRTELYQASNTVTCISAAKDPREPSRMYILILEDNNSEGTSNSIKILKSTDTGETFSSPSVAFTSNEAYGRPFGVADMVISPLNSNVYVAATQTALDGSDIFIARSNNFASDFLAGAKILSNQYVQSIDTLDIAVTTSDPDGQAIFIAFAQGSSSVGSVKLIKGNITTSSFNLLNTVINDTTNKRPYEAEIGTDRDGNIYMVWRDNRASADNPDIYVDYSRDGGLSFSSDLVVNDSTPGSVPTTSPEIIMSTANCEMMIVYEENNEIYVRMG